MYLWLYLLYPAVSSCICCIVLWLRTSCFRAATTTVSSTPRSVSSAAAVRSAGRRRASTSPCLTWPTSRQRSAASSRASSWHGRAFRHPRADRPEGALSERLRRLALARSEPRRAARLGRAGSWASRGSRNSSQLATGASKRAYDPNCASAGVCRIRKKCALRDLGRTG